MTKASRLLFIDLSDSELTPDERELLASRRFGGLCLFGRNIRDKEQLADYVAEVRSLAGAEFIVGIDQEGGGVVRLLDVPYPASAMALGAADDLELTREVAAATARGLRAVGVNIDFAPVADVNVNPLNPVIADRSFGSDPERVSAHVTAFLQGLQSEGVAATVKHFPGHGDTATDSHLALPRLERTADALARTELPPFKAAIAAGVAAVMTGHILIPELDPDLPATLSPNAVRGLLREQLGFSGVVFTDAMNMQAITDAYGPEEATLLALKATADAPLNIGSVAHHLSIADSVDAAEGSGELDAELIAASHARMRTLREAYPAGPGEPAAAWREGDDELLDAAAARGLVALGELPTLAAGEPVTVFAAYGVWHSSAEQQRVGPGPALIDELKRRGWQVTAALYDPERLGDHEYEAALLAQVGASLVVLASSRRHPLAEAEVAFAERVAAGGSGRFVHVALWNPYHAARLPKPALVSFGFRPQSLRAVVRALEGAPVTGRLPVELS